MLWHFTYLQAGYRHVIEGLYTCCNSSNSQRLQREQIQHTFGNVIKIWYHIACYLKCYHNLATSNVPLKSTLASIYPDHPAIPFFSCMRSWCTHPSLNVWFARSSGEPFSAQGWSYGPDVLTFCIGPWNLHRSNNDFLLTGEDKLRKK